MKKLLAALMVLVVMAGFAFAEADRTIPHKAKVVTSNTVICASGTVVYRIWGVATGGANATFGVYDAATLGTATATTIRAEGGEASQYDMIPTIDFGPEGVPFDTGLTVITNNMYVTVEYL